MNGHGLAFDCFPHWYCRAYLRDNNPCFGATSLALMQWGVSLCVKIAKGEFERMDAQLDKIVAALIAAAGGAVIGLGRAAARRDKIEAQARHDAAVAFSTRLKEVEARADAMMLEHVNCERKLGFLESQNQTQAKQIESLLAWRNSIEQNAAGS